jgi:hypothetical protein
MNKKGVEELTIEEIVVIIVVAVGVIFGLVPLLAEYLGSEFKGVDQGTRTSLHNFIEGVNNLINSTTHSQCYIDFSLQDNTAFVAFSRNTDRAVDSATERNWLKEQFGANSVLKPETCSRYACAALCSVGSTADFNNDDIDVQDCAERGIVRPVIFPDVDKFVYADYEKKTGWDVVLYSNIMKYDRLFLDKRIAGFGRFNIYISPLTQELATTETGESVLPCRAIPEAEGVIE